MGSNNAKETKPIHKKPKETIVKNETHRNESI